MPQPIESKAALWSRIDEIFRSRNTAGRLQLLRDLCATNTSLWADATEYVGDLRPSTAPPPRPSN